MIYPRVSIVRHGDQGSTCTPWFAVAESSLPVPLNTFAAQSLKFPVPLRREFLCKALSNMRFRSRAETCCDQNCENSLIFSLLAGYLMRRRVRIGLPPPPRTLLPAGLLHVYQTTRRFKDLAPGFLGFRVSGCALARGFLVSARLSPPPGNRFLARNAETGSTVSETGSQKQ